MSLLTEVDSIVVNSNFYTIDNYPFVPGGTLGDTRVSDLTNAQSNNVLTYNTVSQEWEAQPVKTIQNTNIAPLGNLNNGDVLTWNAPTLEWTPQPGGTSNSVNVSNDTTSTNDQYVAFVNNVGVTNLKADNSGLVYNPDVSLLTVPIINTNLVGGTKGQLVVQDDVDSTTFLATGTATQLLQSNGANVLPTWINQSSVAAGTATSATSATTATNIAGGTSGALPYQSAASTTLFTSVGTAGQVLLSGGTGAPTWGSASSNTISDAAGSVAVASTVNGDITTTLAGTGAAIVQSTTKEGFSNPLSQIITTGNSGFGAFMELYAKKTSISAGDTVGGVSFSGNNNSATKLEYARLDGSIKNKATDGELNFKVLKASTITPGFKVSGDAVTIPFGLRDGSNQTGFSSFLLSSTGTATQWINQSNVTAGNIANGTAGALPYQTGANATTFLTPGTAGYILQSNGAAAPSWVSPFLSSSITASGAGGTGVLSGLTPSVEQYDLIQAMLSATELLQNLNSTSGVTFLPGSYSWKVNTPGVYKIDVWTSVGGPTANAIYTLYLNINGTAVSNTQLYIPTNGLNTSLTLSNTKNLTTNDTISFLQTQYGTTSGANIVLGSGTTVSITRVG